MNRAVYCGVALLGMLTGCTRGIDQQKFAGVYMAGQDIKGATSVGLSWYGPENYSGPSRAKSRRPRMPRKANTSN